MSKTARLLPCPFCGNTRVLIMQDWEIEERSPEEGTGYYAAVCCFQNGGCGASSGYRETKEEACAAWNERTFGYRAADKRDKEVVRRK